MGLQFVAGEIESESSKLADNCRNPEKKKWLASFDKERSSVLPAE